VTYQAGDRVLVCTEPDYGEWAEAVVVGPVESVLVKFMVGSKDRDEWSDPEVVSVVDILKLPKEEK
jgi:hypothetical protein